MRSVAGVLRPNLPERIDSLRLKNQVHEIQQAGYFLAIPLPS